MEQYHRLILAVVDTGASMLRGAKRPHREETRKERDALGAAKDYRSPSSLVGENREAFREIRIVSRAESVLILCFSGR
jgi:hypothetical protein